MSTKTTLKGGKQLEQEDKTQAVIETARISHEQYLDNNTQVKDLLSDFAATALLHKPDDIWLFAREFFEPYRATLQTE